jgi:orotidine-5'-phosphate decarboxylase
MNPRIYVALDYADAASAMATIDRLEPSLCGVKIGKELFTAAGPSLVRECVGRGFGVFLDLKYHDIPNTVAGACAAAVRLGVAMLDVHAAGGASMLKAARDAVDRSARESGQPPPLLIAVTVLTSLAASDLTALGITEAPGQHVMRLAQLAQAERLDGVVCSPLEAQVLRAACGPSFKLVTPGIRLADAAGDDQSRIATPEAALRAGADYLVIGRPVTQAHDPRAALVAIARSIGDLA